MFLILKQWLLSNALRLAGYATIGISVLAVLFSARQAGKNAERVYQLRESVKVKDAQLKAVLTSPSTRRELSDSLRRGNF